MTRVPWVIGLLALVAAQGPERDSVLVGRVVDAQGRPLAQVQVLSLPWGYAVTGADGTFRVERPYDLVRFSADGYAPRTLRRTAVPAEVIMRPSYEPARVLPRCATDVKNDPRQLGDLRYPLPEDARQVRDDHYAMVNVQYRGDWLEHGHGPYWSTGLPSASVWDALTIVVERDVRVDWDSSSPATQPDIAEYQGRFANGSLFRFVGTYGETVSYEDASPEAAAHFDRLIDQLCWAGTVR